MAKVKTKTQNSTNSTPADPKIHLLKSGSRDEARCGIQVVNIVPYRAFSDNPCSCCIKEGLSK